VAAIEPPAWLRASVVETPAADQVLRPSDASDDEELRPRAGASIVARTQAMQRGTLVHRLLQSLPDVAATKRRDAALKYLARNAADWPEAERTRLADRVLAVIEEPRFAQVFAAGSRAEVSIVGRLVLPEQPQTLVSGQIDRLVVTETEVLIVDFKTNHEPPTTLAGVPPAYVRQLALYRAVLGQLYPGRTVRAALLWTETTELMELSASALDAELPFPTRLSDSA
jgi:ATP-dependent helicase/nuclease subunit A